MTTAAGPGPIVSSTGDTGHSRRGQECDSAIRDAALELLAEVGYDRMTMDAVAARAHASKATIYRRWPGKRELVLEAVGCRGAQSAELLYVCDTGSLRGDIIAMLRAMAEGIGREDANLVAGVLRAMRNSPELADCVRTTVVERKRDVGRTIVQRAVARGELPADASAEVFHETAAALMFYRMLVAGEPIDDEYLCHITDGVLVPLLARSGQQHDHNRQET